MDSNELYLYYVTTRHPLQLLHYVRMLPAPESEEIACYFYNRVEKGGVRFVSFHYEKEAEQTLPDPAIVKVIEEVEQE